MFPLSVRGVSTSLPADLVFGLHEFLLYECAVLGICLHGVCVQKLHKCRYDLLVDLVEFVRFFGVHVVNTALGHSVWSCGDRLGGCGIC